MGIVKIASGAPAARSGYSCGDEDLTRDDRMLLQSFPIHESHDSEHVEVDCELAVSRDQMCNVPYGLYDLPDLTETLSLEVWNSCLTEDDRFRLAAFLPDMEEHDFVTTMTELFNVSQARELLVTFQRRRHYHFLKLYHDGMVGKFASLSKLLRNSDTSASLGEKVPISHNWAHEKSSPCVGLSSSTLPITIKDETATVSPMKRAKLLLQTATVSAPGEYAFTTADQKFNMAICEDEASVKNQVSVVPPAWGQAGFKGGEYVSNLSSSRMSMGRRELYLSGPGSQSPDMVACGGYTCFPGRQRTEDRTDH